MSFAVSEADLGTPESRWSALHLERLPALEVGPPGRAVVVAPHPDDEVLGVGGTMRLLDGLGWSVEVVAVTDGEGSHPHHLPAAVASRRRAEVDDALDRLGLGGVPVRRLGLADGGGPGPGAAG